MLEVVSKPPVKSVVVIGSESVGKSQLISSMTGCLAGESNFRGSTVSVQRYQSDGVEYIDTPGILRKSDTDTTCRALAELGQNDLVMLVVRATHLDDELLEMLPLVQGKQGIVVVTFWDKVQLGEAAMEAIERLSRDAGVAFVTVDARELKLKNCERLKQELCSPRLFTKSALASRAGWRIEPKPGWMESPGVGPILAMALLFLPALATIFVANRFADWLHPVVEGWMEPLNASINTNAPAWVRQVLIAEHANVGYGLLNMGPFLLVWALPTVLMFSLILALYKSSGLIERMNVAIHPLVRPFGLSGRDVVRVMMGFGCNVPAVISTRSCSGCSRGAAISAIAFGAACSYQLPATIAVLGAAAQQNGTSSLLLCSIFLGYLLATTLIYLRCTSGAQARNSLNVLMTPSRPFMQFPTVAALWREARATIQQFFLQALPVFALICVIASLFVNIGVLDALSSCIGPVMAVFNLPADASLPVVLASIRKDGIFLFAGDQGLAMPLTSAQTLTAVYLAGVLLPCLVTALTIARETNWRRAGLLLLRQASFAVIFALVLAWGGPWVL
ncbi:Ferrous iron transport protein B [Symmachiella macrocystis]|uniref:Ferrous iron transport protein B n=1 Tax=Symmachiella macrocystis TaxID=2527985 RepID=A0A5C6BJ62_9PLAN|nr:nucleoside recognition domain-containing protein [Symmachiella macrocystis]TWU11717.1 Ferrous iron transport protein B [Symmachiella macrocystis]